MPTIAGDVIRLKVEPEVSSLDFNNGITLSGFRIPSLITRRARTDVELRDGQTFAIAGLLDNKSQNDAAAIPILSKLPIIGHLFRSKSNRAEQTELMVLITPTAGARARSGRSAAAADRTDTFIKKPEPVKKPGGGVSDGLKVRRGSWTRHQPPNVSRLLNSEASHAELPIEAFVGARRRPDSSSRSRCSACLPSPRLSSTTA